MKKNYLKIIKLLNMFLLLIKMINHLFFWKYIVLDKVKKNSYNSVVRFQEQKERSFYEIF